MNSLTEVLDCVEGACMIYERVQSLIFSKCDVCKLTFLQVPKIARRCIIIPHWLHISGALYADGFFCMTCR